MVTGASFKEEDATTDFATPLTERIFMGIPFKSFVGWR
jgi:hypothetical protein